MNDKQQTISNVISGNGIGLHTGINVSFKLFPAEANTGVVFIRNGQEIKAHITNVIDTSRGITIGNSKVRVSSIEHFLAATAGCKIDNIRVEIDGPEMPIFDGSAKPFVELLLSSPKQKQEERLYYDLLEVVSYQDFQMNCYLLGIPEPDFHCTFMIDFNSAVLGTQHATLENIDDFNREISPCRTFCFLHELELLLKHNLIKGGSLGNAIVIVDRPVSQSKLRELGNMFNFPHVSIAKKGTLQNVVLHFQNEPARHKLLDLVGDFVLLGRPLNGRIIAYRSGHLSNIAFIKAIYNNMQRKSEDSNFEFHIALSFAGEDRDYVEEVARILASNRIKVFYDKYEQAELWGKDLYKRLSDVYRNQSQFCVIFISKSYANKLWCNHELRNAQSRAFEESNEYLLPAKFDDTQIPGINPTIGYIDLKDFTPSRFALLIIEKIKPFIGKLKTNNQGG